MKIASDKTQVKPKEKRNEVENNIGINVKRLKRVSDSNYLGSTTNTDAPDEKKAKVYPTATNNMILHSEYTNQRTSIGKHHRYDNHVRSRKNFPYCQEQY